MSQTYDIRRGARNAPAARTPETGVPGPSLRELAAGARPTPEQMGHRVDLPGEIREKMEASFGADFSRVRLYESRTVADAGAEAMTMGANIAFAPGRLDLASTAGQALLGHELSHVVSQARGESAGRGFLADSGLEARADREGALASQGRSVYAGSVTPLSASAVPAAASGVAQAKKKKDIANEAYNYEMTSADIEKQDLKQAKARYRYDNNIGTWQTMPYEKDFDDYLSAALPSQKGGEAQNAMLDAFLNGDRQRISKYLVDDIKRMNSDEMDFSGLLSDDLETRADAYKTMGPQARHMAEVYNLLNSNWDLDVEGEGEDRVDSKTLKAFKRKAENTMTDYDYTSEHLLSVGGSKSEISKDEQENYLRLRRRGFGGKRAKHRMDRFYRPKG